MRSMSADNSKSDHVEGSRSTVGKKPQVRDKSISNGLSQEIWHIVSHTFVLVLTICSIALIQYAMQHILGADAKFFSLVPIRYITDAGNLVALLNYLWSILKDLRNFRK